jgi:hypothetical protein
MQSYIEYVGVFKIIFQNYSFAICMLWLLETYGIINLFSKGIYMCKVRFYNHVNQIFDYVEII